MARLFQDLESLWLNSRTIYTNITMLMQNLACKYKKKLKRRWKLCTLLFHCPVKIYKHTQTERERERERVCVCDTHRQIILKHIEHLTRLHAVLV